METIEEPKRKGNPNFGKKTSKNLGIDNIDPKKTYKFQLVKTYERVKPVDDKTNTMLANPYPPISWVDNEGIALDSDGNMRRWRYVYGFPIWLDEQVAPKLEPTIVQLRDERNVIMFRNGFLDVKGSDTAKVQALLLNDAYEGNENKVNDINPIFKLINPDADLAKMADGVDETYEALRFASESSLDVILPIASSLGIDVSNAKENEQKIKNQFKVIAGQNPSAFMKQVANPINKIKYRVSKGLTENVIKAVDGSIIMVDTGVVVLSGVNTAGDVAHNVAVLFTDGDKAAVKLLDQLKNME